MNEYIRKAMNLLPDSFINSNNELILYPKTNLYICLDNVKNEFDFKCKILEWCSRDSYKSLPFDSERKNNSYHKEIRSFINDYLGTNFDEDDMDIIYTYLGNCVDHELTIEFVKSNYDLSVLLRGKKDEN